MFEKTYPKNIVPIVLFIFCGLPGLLLVLTGASGLIVQLDYYLREGVKVYELDVLSILALCIPVGSVLLLAGVGKLKEWLYIFVFLSFPVFISLTGYIQTVIGFTGTGYEWLILSVILTYIVSILIKKYYDKKQSK